MDDLLAARSQMALSLAFHIVFAMVGMAMPLLMVLAERKWLKTGDAVFLTLAKRWAKGTAVIFAVGAVSGTVLSFELSLLWPEFMDKAGPIFGMPFSLEGFAFFLEAIFLGIYLYGWKRVPPKVHLWCGVGVLAMGTLSGIFVVAANGWMNTPPMTPDGQLVTDVWEAMFNASFFPQALHMTLAAFVSIGFAVAGIHALLLRRDPKSRFHREAYKIALVVAAVTACLQILSGDNSAKHVADTQPAKLAAAEALFETQTCAPLLVGGWPDLEAREVHFGLEIPCALSFLAQGDFDAEVVGLNDIPRDLWPPVHVVHVAFQIMVACGFAMAGVGLLGLILLFRRRELPTQRWYLLLVGLCSPLGVIATEAGWTVTEVGRQPWIIQGVMKTADAVTPMPNLQVTFLGFTLLYVFLGVVVYRILRYHIFAAPAGADPEDAAPDPPDDEVTP